MAGAIKKIIRSIFNLLSILIVIISVILMISVIFSESGKIPDVMGYSMLRVLTGSMAPEIPVNSLIIVQHQKVQQLQTGDVISYYSADPSLDEMVNTHRITRIEKQDDASWIIYTKGDANDMEDEYPTDQNHLIGKVVWSNHLLGVVVRLISNPLIFIPIIIAPLLMILFYHLRQVIHTTKAISREQEEAYKEAIAQIYAQKKKKEAAELEKGETEAPPEGKELVDSEDKVEGKELPDSEDKVEAEDTVDSEDKEEAEDTVNRQEKEQEQEAQEQEQEEQQKVQQQQGSTTTESTTTGSTTE
jgi:signal peptidase I